VTENRHVLPVLALGAAGGRRRLQAARASRRKRLLSVGLEQLQCPDALVTDWIPATTFRGQRESSQEHRGKRSSVNEPSSPGARCSTR